MVKENIVKGEIVQKGAEATLFKGKWFGKDVIFKERVAKNYRIEQLDTFIRTKRTFSEAKALIKVKNYGVNCPQVYDIDPITSTIVMKYIPGKKMKELMNSLQKEKLKEYFNIIGVFIAKLHYNGHIHGDITTSNIIVTPDEEIFLIDFGLHEYSDSIEDKSVDLHLFKRVLQSSHGNLQKTCFQAFLDGYNAEYELNSPNNAKEIIKNISVIETRGRYVKKKDRM
ncbi:MAG: Kae1-associated serine/threonine protein kinase [Candidatus Lokiarchaeota archaeon]|nr:Kae1-associated serine/threonine protein kinase [Candidatus Lokiarchaeota archaeon]